jgi:hypothetical protein
MMKDTSVAEWLTAIATAMQTVVVSVALIVGYIEWRGHESDRQYVKTSEAVKIYDERRREASLEQPFVEQAYELSSCRALQKRAEESATASHIKRDFGDRLVKCKQVKDISERQISEKAPVTLDRLNKIAVCVSTNQCDLAVSLALFCDAAVSFRYLTEDKDIYIIGSPLDPNFSPFVTKCVENNTRAESPNGGGKFYDILTYRVVDRK